MPDAPTASHFCAGRRKPACSHCFVFWLLSLSISYRVTLFWDQSWAFFVAADVLVKARFLPSCDVWLRNSCCVCTRSDGRSMSVVWGNPGGRFRYFDIRTLRETRAFLTVRSRHRGGEDDKIICSASICGHVCRHRFGSSRRRMRVWLPRDEQRRMCGLRVGRWHTGTE